MSYSYDQRKRPQGPQNAAPEPDSAPIPNYQALMSGAARPTAEQKGRPFDLDAAMKAKMENAFGDLSAVKFYESRAVADAGAEAIAQGNEIAFAPGMADFSTRSGQERLGHELSHVMSQRAGQVRGSGFLADSALEARADREGALAAAGQQVYAGPVTHAVSAASPSPMVAGAMQAKKKKDIVTVEPKLDLGPEMITDYDSYLKAVGGGPGADTEEMRDEFSNQFGYDPPAPKQADPAPADLTAQPSPAPDPEQLRLAKKHEAPDLGDYDPNSSEKYIPQDDDGNVEFLKYRNEQLLQRVLELEATVKQLRAQLAGGQG